MTSRRRLFYIDPRSWVDVFRRGVAPADGHLHVLDRWPFPADAEVLAVQWFFDRQAFGVLVAHPSFDEVPDGAEAPGVPYGQLVYRTVQISEPEPCHVI